MTEKILSFSAPCSMRGNDTITPEVWGKLFAVLPGTQISDLK